MTMRTYTDYKCPACGHAGQTKLSENDQPYSKNWERLDVSGPATRALRPGELGYPGERYTCPKCGTDMGVERAA